MLKPGKHAVMVALIVYANDLHFRLDGVHFSCLLNFSESLFEKFDAGSLAWQMDGCKDADPKHIPEYVEDPERRRRPFAASRRSRRSFQTGSESVRPKGCERVLIPGVTKLVFGVRNVFLSAIPDRHSHATIAAGQLGFDSADVPYQRRDVSGSESVGESRFVRGRAFTRTS